MARALSSMLLVLFTLSACSPATSFPNPDLPPDSPVTSPPVVSTSMPGRPANPYAPQTGDERLLRGRVYIEDTQMLMLESYPVQIMVVVSGSLPTPCHELRTLIQPADSEGRIKIGAYSLVDPNLDCIQVLQSFQANLPLGSFSSGHYTVWVNGEKIGEFDT